ncbi:hypothetical protein E2C01_007264 [Portunus trituberculatus]|uniref:Uncharacterized protein n=1 Tax=Portunus trituberculatus TaxID=210409 RepID=A0A5B7CXF0_PORTR|nr:hypothetical protein [Portunus trituberculatus]
MIQAYLDIRSAMKMRKRRESLVKGLRAPLCFLSRQWTRKSERVLVAIPPSPGPEGETKFCSLALCLQK